MKKEYIKDYRCDNVDCQLLQFAIREAMKSAEPEAIAF